MGNDRSTIETKQAETKQAETKQAESKPPAMTDDQRIRASRDSRSLSFAIPTKEADLVPFVLHFARTIASDPQRFITPPEEARTLLELAEEYANLFARAQDRTTRSPGVNARKDAARTIAVKAARTHAKWIKAQPAISVEDKVRLGFALHAGGRR